MRTTFSIIKTDVGGWPGHAAVHPDLKAIANKKLQEAKRNKLLIDFHVTACGDDFELIMTHTNGVDSKETHSLALGTPSAKRHNKQKNLDYTAQDKTFSATHSQETSKGRDQELQK